MTRPEITGNRSLLFSSWIREYLPDSATGFMVTDIDFVISNYKTKKVMLLEVKTRNKEMRAWQYNIYNNLDRWIKKGIDNGWTYLGWHLIRFTGTDFTDSDIYFDNKKVNEQQLINILSF